MFETSWSVKLSNEPTHLSITNVPSPSFVYQGSGNQLMMHSSGGEDIALPIRKEVIGLDILANGQILLLNKYELSCMDLINNDQIFRLEFQNAQKMIVLHQCKNIFVVCGSDLFCYSFEGEEQYVNHFSAGVVSVAAANIKNTVQAIIGLEDMTMLRYKGVNVSFDYGKVIGVPVAICWMEGGSYSINQSNAGMITNTNQKILSEGGVIVGAQDGSVAYYQGKKYKWKAKNAHQILSIITHKTQTLTLAIIARVQGLIELKDWKGKGQTFHKLKIGQPLISVCLYDFRRDDNIQLLCTCKSGMVRAYNILQQSQKKGGGIADQIKTGLDQIQDIYKEKANLQYQIEQLSKRLQNSSKKCNILGADTSNDPLLSSSFTFKYHLNHEEDGLALLISVTDGYISGLSFEEMIMPYQIEKASELRYIFRAENIVVGEINCWMMVHSTFTAKVFQIIPFPIILPKFWKWGMSKGDGINTNDTINTVKFALVERNARYLKWLRSCFFISLSQQDQTKLQTTNPMKLKFKNSYEGKQLQIRFFSKQGKVEVKCNCLKSLGDIFQDLVQYVGVKQLDSQLQFPKEKDKLKDILTVIERLSQNKIAISSQMTQAVQNIKFLLVKAESARVVGQMKELRRTYGQVMAFNRNLITEISKKNQNTSKLSESLKTLGQLINQTSNVRFGKAKEAVIAGCRDAIKKRDFHKIISIMERGMAAV